MINKLKNLRNHHGFMKYFKNTSWLFMEKILRMIVGLFIGIWVARYLGPEQFGLFSYALAFISMFGFFVTLGMDGGYIVKELKSVKPQKIILATVLFLKFIGSLLAITIISIIIRLIEDDTLTITLVTIASFSYIFRIFSVFDLYFQSKVLSKYIVWSNLLALFLVSLVRVYFILSDATIEAFIYSLILEIALASIFFIYFYVKYSSDFKGFHIDIFYAKDILSNTWPAIISAFLVLVYLQIDIVMIKNILGDSEAGNYAAAAKISALFYFIPTAITSSIYPAILNAKKTDESLYYKHFEQLFNFSVLFMFPVALFVTFYSDNIINILYTDSFIVAASVLPILIWASVFVFFNNIQAKWYITEHLQKLILIRIIFATFVNIVLNLYLIPRYGIIGAAYSTLISYTISGYFGNLFFGRITLKLFKLQSSALMVFPIFIKMLRKK